MSYPYGLLMIVLLALAPGAAADSHKADAPITPSNPIKLFNGRNFDGLYSWLAATGPDDPEGVFSVKDGMIHMKGGEHRGYIATKQAYRDFHLSCEYKWGKTTDGGKYVRNSGILLHAVGPDGGASKKRWMTSIEVQLAQGCEGDLIVIRGKDTDGKTIPATISCRVRVAEDKKTRWDPKGKLVKYSGRQFWWNNHQPFFKELLDTRGKNDVASPYGQWTKVECISRGDKFTIKINGVAVNAAENVFPSAGKILFQNEGHEVYFRNVELKPLAKAEEGEPKGKDKK